MVIIVVVIVVAALAIAALSGRLNFSSQTTYPAATVSGKITGNAFTEGNALGNVTAMYFQPSSGGQSQGNGFPAVIKGDGTYSIKLTNGMNYTVFMNVVNPDNNSDTGLCQGQTVALNSPQKASYVFDMTPVNCG